MVVGVVGCLPPQPCRLVLLLPPAKSTVHIRAGDRSLNRCFLDARRRKSGRGVSLCVSLLFFPVEAEPVRPARCAPDRRHHPHPQAARYSMSKGLFAGFGVGAGFLRVADRVNERFYGAQVQNSTAVLT